MLMPELQKFMCFENEICKNKNIKEALALVLPADVYEVKIQYDSNTASKIRQLQKNLDNIRSPFTKTIDEMLDEQFYEDHKLEIK